MPIVSHVILGVDFREEAVTRVVEQWAEGLKNNAVRINEKRKAKIAREEDFQDRMAEPSSLKYAPSLNPGFVNEAGEDANAIITSQQTNLSRSFKKYNDKLDYLFETVDGIPAKRFKELVDIAKNDFSRGIAARSLPLTGTKIESLGPAAIAALWLTGSRKVIDSLRPGDEVKEGGPYMICLKTERPALKAAVVQRIVQAGAAIIKASYAPTVLTAQNDRTNRIVQGFVNPGLGLSPFTTGGLSRVDFILIHDRPYLEIQVFQV